MENKSISSNPSSDEFSDKEIRIRQLHQWEINDFVTNSYIILEDLWTNPVGKILENEAKYILNKKIHPKDKDLKINTSYEFKSQSGIINPKAPFLSHVHISLLSLVRSITGRMMVPIHAWYNFYLEDDGLFLHIDSDGSELVVLTGVFGDVGPLYLFPNLKGKTQEELDKIIFHSSSLNENTIVVKYPSNGVFIHRGNILPHYRPKRTLKKPAAVAAFHYRSLF